MDYIAPLELKFKKVSVWVKPVQIHVYNASTGKHDEGKWLCYYSFSMPGQVFYGETVMHENSRPRMWKTADKAVAFSKIFFDYIID